ncbi:hypothetical protein AAE02nite_50540 [Adhaeribacter aerolatus]|uniref:Aerotolerance regulator N-terminal domain-containing protein n=1 Tax=Adhaeribacter aerolatus TaxID=670289 RepID=A0A512B608_9BACT|nr:BatA domain-containing protein [Adhaeribacter aerolatus]GEO07390.1 hypothetical protein AAE02nite_50540 [Adhaeribacter aerolatus]
MNFVAPLFLYALSAIAIPIILHLVELRRAKRVLFTNVSFIKEVKNITSKHRRLKQLLILLARISFIIFLVLVFAQPYLPANSTIDNARDYKIYIDNSLSMQNESKEANRNLLDQAVSHSQRILSNLSASNRINIQDNFRRTNSYTDYTAIKAKNYLADLKLSANTKNFPALLAGFSVGTPKPYNAFIYSDFQRNTFHLNYIADLAQAPNDYYLVHLKGNATYNAFVDSIYLEDEFVRLNANNKIRVRIRNSGTDNVEGSNVKFFIGEQQVSALSVSIPAKQTKTVDLVYRLTDTALKPCRIVLQDYPIDFDNTYYFTLQASAQINVVDVAENRNAPTTRVFTNEPLFKYQVVSPQQFNYTLLKETDLVILNAVTQLTPAFAENLEEYVRGGGNVAFIPANTGNANSYATFFQRLGLNNIRYQPIAGTTAPVPVELAALDVNNPFFTNIFEANATKMKMPGAAPVLSWNRSSADILKYRNGGNFLSEFRKGTGKVYLFSTPLQEEFTDFPNHAIFVPIMYKMAMQSYKQKQEVAYTLGGAVIQYPVSNNNSKEVIKLVRDSLAFIPEQQVKDGVANLVVPDDLNEAGFYKLQVGNTDLTTVALNYNKKESELDTYSLTDLKNMVGDAKNIKVLDASDEIGIKNLVAQDNLGTQLWKYCLILCLIFALTEILLIRFM